MAASDLTATAFIYKKKYGDKQTMDISVRDHVLYAMITKRGDFVGTSFDYPVRYSNPQGISGTFSTAQSAAASSKGMQLVASRKAKYGVITLNGEAIAACANQGAFYDLVTMETDGVLEEMGDSFAFDLYHDTYGIRGRRSSASSNVITLTDPHDVHNFKVGMTVGADDTSTGASPRVGTTTVAGVSISAGTITLTDASAIASFQDNDYLFRAGDPSTCMEGAEVCTPLTAPTAGDSFRGKDRSVDVEGLAGSRISDTATNPEENLGILAVNMSKRARKGNRIATLNPTRFWEVSRRRDAKVMYDNGGGTAEYGFEYIVINTPGGTLKVFSDPDCPANRGRIWTMEYHHLKHLKGLPHIIMDDDNSSLRSTSADDIEARARGWVNYIQTVPACFGVIEI